MKPDYLYEETTTPIINTFTIIDNGDNQRTVISNDVLSKEQMKNIYQMYASTNYAWEYDELKSIFEQFGCEVNFYDLNIEGDIYL